MGKATFNGMSPAVLRTGEPACRGGWKGAFMEEGGTAEAEMDTREEQVGKEEAVSCADVVRPSRTGMQGWPWNHHREGHCW